ncbi:unnamed protein product [Citrullus colocynthis]|uniref:Uncharacterized protein n=1 Tax=Citrullus colocynthis TaxID=252529 RepID=A0ABP0XTA8_9ROSI
MKLPKPVLQVIGTYLRRRRRRNSDYRNNVVLLSDRVLGLVPLGLIKEGMQLRQDTKDQAGPELTGKTSSTVSVSTS